MFQSVGSLTLDNGVALNEITLAFQRWGQPTPQGDNIVMVLHALTGDSHVVGPPDKNNTSPGWWDALIGINKTVDTTQWCVIAANVLGGCRGSTGPTTLTDDGKPWGSRFPIITVRDQVRAERLLIDSLGITALAAVIGGSMGGARALEWTIEYPECVRSALILAVGARATADQIGTQSSQIRAIKADPYWQGGDYYGTGNTPDEGLAIARQIAHLSYRSEKELDERFSNDPQSDTDPLTGGSYQIQSYLDYQATKLVNRFDAGSYVILSDALNHHDVGRNRGGIATALQSTPVPVIVGGISSDRLYPLRLQQEIATLMPGCVDGLHIVESSSGHDGFLTEFDAIATLLTKTLALANRN